MHNAKKTEEIMTSKKVFLSLTILQTFILTSFGQTVVIPKEFVETIPPKAMSADWYPLNYSKNEFGVKIIDHKLKIKKVKEINNCEKSTLPNNNPIGGIITFVTRDLISVANAAPKINPTAISTTFPFIRKSLNSFNITYS